MFERVSHSLTIVYMAKVRKLENISFNVTIFRILSSKNYALREQNDQRTILDNLTTWNVALKQSYAS